MKSTKIVDITLCDLCNVENYLKACISCKKEVCGKCRQSFSLWLYRYTAKSPSYDAEFCSSCSHKAIATFMEMGFTLRPEPAAEEPDQKSQHHSEPESLVSSAEIQQSDSRSRTAAVK